MWRVHWAAAIALVRAVGHVLDKVDGERPGVKQAARTLFKEWKSGDEHLIFRKFIDDERNNLLKQYQSRVHPLENVPVLLQGVAPDGNGPCAIIELGENVYRPMADGPWAGDDAREVYGEAIQWWERQLARVDSMARAQRK